MTTTGSPLGLPGDQLPTLVPENITIVYDNSTEFNATIPDYDYLDMFTEFTEYKVAEFINKYYLYVICAVGIPGNVACIITLLFMRPIASSTVYMTTLAVVDIIAVTLKMVYFQLTAHDKQLGDRGCQIMFFLGTVSQQYSNWLLVAMTVERFIAIWFPFQVKTFCTRTKAIVITVMLLVFFTLANLQFIFTFEETQDSYLSWDCQPKPKYADFVQYVWYWIDGAFYAIIPIVLLVVLNGLIVCAVRRSSRSQRDLTNCSSTEQPSQQRQITIMLMTISLVFVLLVLPNCVFFIAREYWAWQDTHQGIAQYFLFYQLVFLLSDLNHALNFYLYCLSGRKFRQKFVQIICCRRRRISELSRSYFSTIAASRVHGKTSVTSLSNVSHTCNNNPEVQVRTNSHTRPGCHM